MSVSNLFNPENALLKRELKKAQDRIDELERLIDGSLQIAFNSGPAVQRLLSEELGPPTLTDDKTAVKAENVLFTVLIAPFQERITVRDVSDKVPERSFRVRGGRLSVDDQTLLLGHIDRIKAAAGDAGEDPVKHTVNLVVQTSSA
jgi:hypothetical protein